MEFLIIFQLFSVFCWFFSSPSCSGPHLACSSISGYFWHCSWQGKVLQYSSPPHGCDSSTLFLLLNFCIHFGFQEKILYISYLGGEGGRLPLLSVTSVPEEAGVQHISCAESQRGGAHVGASSQEEPWPHQSRHQSAPSETAWQSQPGGTPVSVPSCVWSRRARGGLVRERRRRAGPWWGN